MAQKALPGPGSTSLHMARHSNPKYISLVKKIAIKSIPKKMFFSDIDYATLYIPLGTTQIS